MESAFERSESADVDERDISFGVLSDEQRCQALRYLCEADGSVTVEELVAQVSKAVGGTERRLEVRFHHVHLPKMESVGLLDRDGAELEPTDAAYRTKGILDAL